jgi:lipooligosaccharide transport system permease protein
MANPWTAVFGNVSYRAWKVWMRDLEVYRTTWKTNFLPPLLEPVLYVLAFGVGMGRLVGNIEYQGSTLTYLQFMFPGVISVAVMFWAFFETTYSSFIRMYYQRTFEAIVATPLQAEDLIAGEWLWGASKSVIAAVLMLVMMSIFGLVNWPSGILVIGIALLGGLLFSALGLIVTAISPTIETFNVPIFVVIFPMFLFSGTFFPIDILPGWAMTVAMCLPLTHVSYLIRGACLGMLPPFWIWNLAYMVVLAFLLTGLSIVLLRRRLLK